LIELATYWDANDTQVTIRYEGVQAAPPPLHPERWWDEQQRKPAERRKLRDQL
jgi:hypothetical protein